MKDEKQSKALIYIYIYIIEQDVKDLQKKKEIYHDGPGLQQN